MAQQKRTLHAKSLVPVTKEKIDLKTLVVLILRSGIYPGKPARGRNASVRSAITYHLKIKNLSVDDHGLFSRGQALAWANVRWKGCVQAEIDAYPQRYATEAFAVDAGSPTQQASVSISSYSNNPLALKKALLDAEIRIKQLTAQLEQCMEDATRYQNICKRNRLSAQKRWRQRR
ncbi:hypothetical protein H0A65_17005 [Alcaligenaceae bacterium]|nr:hypothetical protein [Alcaligenaceae bacterium]